MESTNDSIKERADFLAGHLNKQNIRSVILIMLYDLRIPLNCSGFDYLKNAIEIAFQNPSQIVASEIYDAVGNLYSPKVSSRNMDSAIRDAIKKAWKSRTDDRWGRYLPEYLIERKSPPTNLEFLSAVVYFLELWQDSYVKEASSERT